MSVQSFVLFCSACFGRWRSVRYLLSGRKWPAVSALVVWVWATSLSPGQDVQAQITRLNEQMYYTRMSNDLAAVVVEDTTVPVAVLTVAVQGGISAQETAYEGIPFLFEQLIFRPNYYYPTREQFEQAQDRFNLQLKARTGSYAHTYSATLPIGDLAPGFAFLGHAVQFPRFDTVEVRDAVNYWARKLETSPPTPQELLTNEVQRALWGAEALRFISRPDFSRLREASYYRLHSYHSRTHQPGRTLVILNGALKHQRGFELVDSLFRNWENEPGQHLRAPEPRPLSRDSVFISVVEQAEYPYARMAWQLPATLDNPRLAITALLFGELLRLQHSRFAEEMLHTGLLHQVDVAFQPGPVRSQLDLIFVPDVVRMTEGIDTLKQAFLDMIQTRYFSYFDLEEARQRLKAAHFFGQEDWLQHNRRLAQWWSGISLAGYGKFVEYLEQITTQDIQRFIHQYCVNNYYVLGMTLNSRQLYDSGADTYFRTAFPRRLLGSPSKKKRAEYTSLDDNTLAGLMGSLSSSRLARVLAMLPDTLLGAVFRKLPNERISAMFASLPDEQIASTFRSLTEQKLGNPQSPDRPENERSLEELSAALSSFYEVLVPPDTLDEEVYEPPSYDLSGIQVFMAESPLELDGEDREALLKVAEMMYEFPDLVIYINGHTANLPGPENHPVRSMEMARLVKRHLIRYYNIASERMLIRGFGNTRPAFREHTRAGTLKNRRVTFSTR